MEKQELYHFHRIGNYDNLWQERKVIRVPRNFQNRLFRICHDFTTTVDTEFGSIDYLELIAKLYKQEDIAYEQIEEMLNMASKIIYQANLFKREMALEKYREEKAPYLPSRLHSLYLTDEAGVESWKNKLGRGSFILFKVEASGIIFKTNEQFIPDNSSSYHEVYKQARAYWHPNLKNAPLNTNEYLVQGKVKILKKIDRF